MNADLKDMSALKSDPPSPIYRGYGVMVHLFVFAATATAAFLGYTLLL